MANYISKIVLPGGTSAYLIKDNEGRLMIANNYVVTKNYAVGDYFVKDGKFYVVTVAGPQAATGGHSSETTVGDELKAIKSAISSSMHFIGITRTALTDGAATAELTPYSTGSLTKTSGFVDGDVVLVKDAAHSADGDVTDEFVNVGGLWYNYGSSTHIKALAFKDSASGTYVKPTGAGNVTIKKYTATSDLATDAALVPAAVKSYSASKSNLVTTSIKGVAADTATASSITNKTAGKLVTTKIKGVSGTETKTIGGTNVTVATGSLGTAAAANGTNPFVNAVVGAVAGVIDSDTETLSWTAAPISTTTVKPAASETITVAKAADAEIYVATGAVAANGTGSGVVTDLTYSSVTGLAKPAGTETQVATGTVDANGTGASIATDVTSTDSSVKHYVLGNIEDTGAIRVISTVTEGTETVNVTVGTENATVTVS